VFKVSKFEASSISINEKIRRNKNKRSKEGKIEN
jgi:hypothetical protein